MLRIPINMLLHQTMMFRCNNVFIFIGILVTLIISILILTLRIYMPRKQALLNKTAQGRMETHETRTQFIRWGYIFLRDVVFPMW